MRTIKFRGRTANGYVYGDLIQWDATHNYIAYNREVLSVEPDSVAQLIAVDIKGREVYEGDLVKRIADSDDPDFDASKSFPLKATFEDYGGILDGEKILVEATS